MRRRKRGHNAKTKLADEVEGGRPQGREEGRGKVRANEYEGREAGRKIACLDHRQRFLQQRQRSIFIEKDSAGGAHYSGVQTNSGRETGAKIESNGQPRPAARARPDRRCISTFQKVGLMRTIAAAAGRTRASASGDARMRLSSPLATAHLTSRDSRYTRNARSPERTDGRGGERGSGA